jgi:hypothetical protein
MLHPEEAPPSIGRRAGTQGAVGQRRTIPHALDLGDKPACPVPLGHLRFTSMLIAVSATVGILCTGEKVNARHWNWKSELRVATAIGSRSVMRPKLRTSCSTQHYVFFRGF